MGQGLSHIAERGTRREFARREVTEAAQFFSLSLWERVGVREELRA